MEISGFYKEVIQKLNEQNVEYLLVGGLAVGFYGYARFTGDMDLWLNPTSENLNRLAKSLLELNYSKQVVKDILNSRPTDHPTPIRIFSEDGFLKVDLMTSILYEPLTFKSCFQRSSKQKISNQEVCVIGIRDLIEIKSNVNRSTGSLKDLVDAQELQKILERGEILQIDRKPSLLDKILKFFS